jgi:hypothetical protein
MSSISFNQVAQLVKKFDRVGWDAARITALGQANAKKFRAIEAILDGASFDTALQATGGVGSDTTHLRFLQSAMLAPTSGLTTLAQAGDVFTGFLDSDFKNWGTDVASVDTEETLVDIYEMKKNGTYAQLFGSLSANPRSLCLTQGQIKEFPQTHRHLLRQDGYATFFLFEVNGVLFVAHVNVDGGLLVVYVNPFSRDLVWGADLRSRVVVPQQTL